MLVNVQEWGCFSIFRRADDVTQTMSKGGCVLVNVQELGCFSIFRRADDVTQTMSKGGWCLWNVFTPPPSGNPVSAPVICAKFRANQPLCPPNQSVPIRLWVGVRVLEKASPCKARNLGVGVKLTPLVRLNRDGSRRGSLGGGAHTGGGGHSVLFVNYLGLFVIVIWVYLLNQFFERSRGGGDGTCPLDLPRPRVGLHIL